MTSASNTPRLLEVLGRHEVDFIVVGLTAAVLQGAPVVTFDLDIVYARVRTFTSEHHEDARCARRGRSGVSKHAVRLDVGERSVLALGLPRLIEVKQRAGRPKDLAVLPVLRATLERASTGRG